MREILETWGQRIGIGLDFVGAALMTLWPEVSIAFLIIGTLLIIWPLIDWLYRRLRKDSGSDKIWLTEAVVLVAAKMLKKKKETLRDAEWMVVAGNILDRVRELACDGKIKVYGSMGFDPLPIEISAEFWRNNQINIFGVLRGSAKDTKTEVRRGQEIEPYVGLKLLKSEINKISRHPVSSRHKKPHPFG